MRVAEKRIRRTPRASQTLQGEKLSHRVEQTPAAPQEDLLVGLPSQIGNPVLGNDYVPQMAGYGAMTIIEHDIGQYLALG